MTIKARRWNLIVAASGAAGLLLLAARTDSAVAGVLAGAAAVGIAFLGAVERRLAQLAKEGEDLADARARYDAAYATLSGQRERLRTAMEGELAERLAQMEDRHRRELLAARVNAYTDGVMHILTGRLAPVPAADDDAEIISLAARRPQPSTTAGDPSR